MGFPIQRFVLFNRRVGWTASEMHSWQFT